MADEKKLTDVVLFGNPSGAVSRVSIDGNEFEVSGASVVMQGGQVGVSLTIIGCSVRGEQVAQPASPAPLSPGQAS